MVKVRVIRPVMLEGQRRHPGDVLTLHESVARSLADDGLIVLLVESPAPETYRDRALLPGDYRRRRCSR